MDDKPDTPETILAAMDRLGAADAKAIAGAAGLAYSTVTKNLRALADAGRVHRTDVGDGPTRWRRTDPANVAADPHPQLSQPGPDAAAGESTEDAAPAGADGTSHPHTDEPAQVRHGVGGEPAATAPPSPPAETATPPADADGQPPTTPGPAPTGEADTPPAGGTATTAGRRAKGQLREAVLKVLRDNPQPQYSPSQISKLLGGASQGAIRNNLHTLTIHGTVRLTQEKPERFQAV